jgi:ATP-dependent DNA helicase RecG
MRVLAGFGYVRELGEGIPRMFAEMEREGFYPPRFDSIAGVTFTVTLRNEPVYSRQTLSWLQAFGELKLSGDQKRLLAYAHAHGNRFTSRDYQKLTGLDIYGASSSIKELIRKGAARSTAKGSRIYEVVSPADLTVTVPLAVAALLPVLAAGGAVTNHDIRQSLQTSRVSATRIANDLCRAGWLQRQGSGRWTRYLLTPEAMNQLRNVSVEAEGDS